MSVSELLAQVVPAKEWPLPADLAVVVLHTFVTVGALLVPLVSGTPLRSVVGLSFVVFTPGYTVVSVLFPERYRSTEPAGGTSTTEAGGVLLARFRGSAGIGPVEQGRQRGDVADRTRPRLDDDRPRAPCELPPLRRRATGRADDRKRRPVTAVMSRYRPIVTACGSERNAK